MKSILVKCIAVLVIAGWTGMANAIPIVEFTSVNGTNVAADVEGPGVTGFNLGRSAGLIQNSGGTFNSRGWLLSGDKPAAVAANDAIFWGFDSLLGYDLTSLSFGYDRSGTGPSSIAVDFFINNILQGEIFSDTSVAANSTAIATIDLSSFDNVTNGFFRLTGWNATSTAGTFDIENRTALSGKGIIINGELAAAPVPEPATLALFGLGLAGLGFVRRKRA
jgi:hypothetical protein